MKLNQEQIESELKALKNVLLQHRTIMKQLVEALKFAHNLSPARSDMRLLDQVRFVKNKAESALSAAKQLEEGK